MTVPRAVFLGCLLSVTLVFPSGKTRAADTAPPKAVVWIEPIVDSGGADQKMGDGETLARRFTKGFSVALESEAKERFAVRIASRSPALTGVRFVLRGGLSRVQGEENVPYVCIVRLFEESVSPDGKRKTRRLVGQWAGTARGLRDLTGNLSRDPRVHVLGLAGELSRRISNATLRRIDPAVPVTPPSPFANGEDAPAVLVLEGGMAAAPPTKVGSGPLTPVNGGTRGTRYKARARLLSSCPPVYGG
jgi:hypothetical protein